jgi:hypothetical protein
MLAESQDFQGSIGSGLEESAHGSKEGEEQLKHERRVLTWRNTMSIGALEIAQLIDFVSRRGIVYAQVTATSPVRPTPCRQWITAFLPLDSARSNRLTVAPT